VNRGYLEDNRILFMGRSYLFECSKCSYQSRVSGGVDSGLDCRVQTASCHDCRNLFDAVIRLRVPDIKIPAQFHRLRTRMTQEPSPPFDAAINRLPPSGAKLKWLTFKIQCPVSTEHRVRAWNDPGKCPRCGNFMEKNALPFRYWD